MDILKRIEELQDLFDEDEVTTADKINRPEPKQSVKEIELFNEFNTRNPKADGGRIGFKKNPLKNFNKKTNDPKKGIIKISEKSIEENIKEIKWLNKANNKEIVVYKTRILDRPKKIKGKQTAGKSGNYKTLFMEEYSTLKEARDARDNFREKNPKKFTPADPKKRPESKTKRRFFQSLEEGRQGSYKTPKGYVLHHMMPIGDAIPTKLNEYAIIDKYMNAALTKYDEKILNLVNEAYDLDFNNVKADSTKLDKINKKLFGVLEEIKKEMPKEYQGLLGFNKLTPVTDEYGNVFRYNAEPVGLDYTKSIAGKKQNVPVKILEKKQVQKVVDKAPKIKGLKSFMKANGIKCFVSKSTGGSVTCDMPQAYEKSLNQISKSAAAGDSAAQSKLLNFRKAVRGAGGVIKGVLGPAAIAAEIGIAIPIGLFDYAQGKPTEEIVNTLTYGLAGKSRDDRLKKEMPSYGQGDALQSAFDGYLSTLNRLGEERDPNQLRPGKKTDDMLKTFYEKQEPFMRVNPQVEEGRMFDLDMFRKNVAESRAAKERLAEEDLKRKQERRTPFNLSDPFMAADGGLSGGDKSGPPPESGPTPHGDEGLPGIFKRVKKQ